MRKVYCNAILIPLRFLLISILCISLSQATRAQDRSAPIRIFIDGRDPKREAPSTPLSGLKILRFELMGKMAMADSDFVFKKGNDVNGFPEYMAIDRYKTSMEIIGTEHNVREAKWTLIFTPDRSVNDRLFEKMAYFVFLFAGNAGNEWLDKKLDQMADHPSDELTEKKEFKVGRKIEFKYAPSQKGIMITASADH